MKRTEAALWKQYIGSLRKKWRLPMNLQRIFILIAAAVLTAAFGQYYFRKKKLLFKALATCMPVAVALLYTLRAGEQGRFVSLLILAGAFLCMTADVLLELVFLAGVAAFALGHVCFLTAYISPHPGTPDDGNSFFAAADSHASASREISS